MKIFKILYYAYKSTPNLYKSVFGNEINYDFLFKSGEKDKNNKNNKKNDDILKEKDIEIESEKFNLLDYILFIYNFCFIKIPLHCPSWMPNIIRLIFFGENSRYIKNNKELDENNNCFIYINGVLGSEIGNLNTKIELENYLKKPVNLLVNSSDTLLSDLIESLVGKQTEELTEASTVALFTISKKLLDDNINKVIILAYSQGTIIISSVLNSLYKIGLNKEKYLKKLEIYCFSNCSSKMKYVVNELPYIESFANDNDFVAKLGCNCPDEIKDLIDIDGKIFINKDGHGHMLNSHYLHNFSKNYPLSKLNYYFTSLVI